jgi:NCS1 family nucleobase:cation symporter-1
MIENKGLAQVTAEESYGKPSHLFGLWMAVNVEFATITTGAIATGVFGLSLLDAVLGILSANVIGCLLLGLFSTYGVDYGLPMMITCERWFGRSGNRVLSSLTFLSGFSWFAINTVIGAYFVQHVLGFNLAASITGLTLVQVLIAIIGHDFIIKAEKTFFWFLSAVFAVLTIMTLAHISRLPAADPVKLAMVGGRSGAFLLTVSVMLSWLGGWILFSGDYSRYMRYQTNRAAVKRGVFWNACIGCFVSSTWLEVLGAILGGTIALKTPADLFSPWLPGWFRVPLIIAIVVGTISPNVLNIYSAGLSALASGVRMKQWQAALLTGGIGLLIALITYRNFYQDYELLLFFLGYVIFPRFPVMAIAHVRPRVSRLSHIDVTTAGFLAWLSGLLCSVPFWNQPPVFVGWFAADFPRFGDISFFVGAAVAALVYLGTTAPGPAAVPAADACRT